MIKQKKRWNLVTCIMPRVPLLMLTDLSIYGNTNNYNDYLPQILLKAKAAYWIALNEIKVNLVSKEISDVINPIKNHGRPF